MIKIVSGDILRATSTYIVAGVATGKQDSPCEGLATRISSKWPEAQKHLRQFARGNKFLGGDQFVVAPAKNRPGIIYMATQGETDEVAASYLNTGLRRLERYCAKRDIESVSLPGAGSGLGPPDWQAEVKPLMEKYFEYGKTIFQIFENPDK